MSYFDFEIIIIYFQIKFKLKIFTSTNSSGNLKGETENDQVIYIKIGLTESSGVWQIIQMNTICGKTVQSRNLLQLFTCKLEGSIVLSGPFRLSRHLRQQDFSEKILSLVLYMPNIRRYVKKGLVFPYEVLGRYKILVLMKLLYNLLM